MLPFVAKLVLQLLAVVTLGVVILLPIVTESIVTTSIIGGGSGDTVYSSCNAS